MATVLTPNINQQVSQSILASVSDLELFPSVAEKPSFTVDTMSVAGTSNRTVGANLTETASTNSAYQLTQQKTYLQYTVVTATTNETLAWSQILDFTATDQTGLFNSGETPTLLILINPVSGLTTTTVAQRTVNLQIKDTAGTPKIYGAAASALPLGAVTDVVANFAQVIEPLTGASVDITGSTNGGYAVQFPLDSLTSSTTKKFTLGLQFNFPVGAVYNMYILNGYRQMENCAIVGSSPIAVQYPANVKFSIQQKVNYVQDPLGRTVAAKTLAKEIDLSFQIPNMPMESVRKLFGMARRAGGNNRYPTVTTTIPNSSPYEISSTLPSLQYIALTADYTKAIVITRTDATGNVSIMQPALGSYIASGQYVFIYDVSGAGAGNKIRFSSVDVGQTITVAVTAATTSGFSGDMDALSTIVLANGRFSGTDNGNPTTSTSKALFEVRSLIMTANLNLAGVGDNSVFTIEVTGKALILPNSPSPIKISYTNSVQ